MNGAESLMRTLVANGIDTCFANPGTSEMHFVAALDKVDGLRCVLCLFEGVVTGAADGYYRMAERPAATLLHLGPGLANGLANLHNAKKAGSGVVNIVGEHASYHIRCNAPLTADIEGLARPMSHWVRTSASSKAVARDGAEAIAAASATPGHIATLILPADAAWGLADGIAQAPAAPRRREVSDGAVDAAAKALSAGEAALLLSRRRGGRCIWRRDRRGNRRFCCPNQTFRGCSAAWSCQPAHSVPDRCGCSALERLQVGSACWRETASRIFRLSRQTELPFVGSMSRHGTGDNRG
jgi:thiamine pyrophosphate-dependent acetolactate synthase large subunit-like protein